MISIASARRGGPSHSPTSYLGERSDGVFQVGARDESSLVAACAPCSGWKGVALRARMLVVGYALHVAQHALARTRSCLARAVKSAMNIALTNVSDATSANAGRDGAAFQQGAVC